MQFGKTRGFKTGGLLAGTLVTLLTAALAEDGIEREESTLYPLLRRLEGQGLLLSEWREEEKRKKRFYRLSPEGEAMLTRLADEWRRIGASLERIL